MRVGDNRRFVAAQIRVTHLAGFGGWHMFYCSIYLGAGKTRILSSNQWDKLRKDVAAILKKKPELKWGALRDDDGMYVGRFRKGISGFPKKQPTKYLPMKDLFKLPPK